MGWRPWCLLCPAGTAWTAINCTYLCLSPVGIQLSAFLFAESTIDFNRLEGKIEQRNCNLLTVLFLLHFHLKKHSAGKSLWVHKFQHTHDGFLQSYQNMGKRNCCIKIPTKIWDLETFYYTFHSLIFIPVCPFPNHLDKKLPVNYHNMSVHWTSWNPKYSNDPLPYIALS